MLATLFDFPWEDRAKLTYWSDATTALPGEGFIKSEEHRMSILMECAQYMTRLWNERINADGGSDLLSMLAHDPRTRHMTPEEFLGNVLLLIVGGNDTSAVPETLCKPFADPFDGVRGYPLADAAGAYAAYRDARRCAWWQEHPQGRQSGDVVRLRQSR
jgi:hypothetical protein